jgi:tryptophan synthase beta subunit
MRSLFLPRVIALESSHALWAGVQLAKTLPKETDIVIVSFAKLFERGVELNIMKIVSIGTR